jgi:hypothetical protein
MTNILSPKAHLEKLLQYHIIDKGRVITIKDDASSREIGIILDTYGRET